MMSCSSWNSWPTRSSASRRLGVTKSGWARTPWRSGSPEPSRMVWQRARCDAPQDLGVEVVGHLAGQRPADDHVVGALGQVLDLVEEGLALLLGDHRAPLVDLGLAEAGRVDDRGGGTRLAGDAHEVVEDALAREPLDDLLAGAPADEPAGHHRLADGAQRARDVDALAARQGEALARAMPEARDEVGHGQRLVDGGVGCEGDDHVSRRSLVTSVAALTWTCPAGRPSGSASIAPP